MRSTSIVAALLFASCSGNSDQSQVNADNSAAEVATGESNVSDELINNPNGEGQVLRLEGNDSATFVDGELVEVNRAQ